MRGNAPRTPNVNVSVLLWGRLSDLVLSVQWVRSNVEGALPEAWSITSGCSASTSDKSTPRKKSESGLVILPPSCEPRDKHVMRENTGFRTIPYAQHPRMCVTQRAAAHPAPWNNRTKVDKVVVISRLGTHWTERSLVGMGMRCLQSWLIRDSIHRRAHWKRNWLSSKLTDEIDSWIELTADWWDSDLNTARFNCLGLCFMVCDAAATWSLRHYNDSLRGLIRNFAWAVCIVQVSPLDLASWTRNHPGFATLLWKLIVGKKTVARQYVTISQPLGSSQRIQM